MHAHTHTYYIFVSKLQVKHHQIQSRVNLVDTGQAWDMDIVFFYVAASCIVRGWNNKNYLYINAQHKLSLSTGRSSSKIICWQSCRKQFVLLICINVSMCIESVVTWHNWMRGVSGFSATRQAIMASCSNLIVSSSVINAWVLSYQCKCSTCFL